VSREDKLVVDGDDGAYRIVWELVEEGDLGAALGEFGSEDYTDEALAKEKDPEGRDHMVANLTLIKHKPAIRRDSSGFLWDSMTAARRALTLVNAAIKADRAKRSGKMIGWPEWAVTAAAHGWKPPKGWKP
jgi:hypothetical protein